MTITNDFFDRLEGVWQNKLDGQWQDNLGWNLITQPRRGESGTSDFGIRVDQMRETITFRKLGIARNIGVSGEEGFWEGMAYEIEIKKMEDGVEQGIIHHEMGHFLL